MEAKPNWRTWAEPLRRDGRSKGRNGRDARQRSSLSHTAEPIAPTAHSTLMDCCIATGGVALALLLRKALGPLLGPAQPLVTFCFATFAAAWFGGALPGLLSLMLGALAGWYFFIHVNRAASAGSAASLVNIILFCGVGLCAIALTAAYRWAIYRAENADETAQLYQEEIARQSSERSAVERALRAADERFGTAMDANLIGMATLDAKGAVTRANDALLKILDYSRDEFESQPRAWHDLANVDSGGEHTAIAALAQPVERELLHRDGATRVPALVSAVEFDPAGGGVVFVLDLSPLEQARRTLELQSRVLESMAEGVVVDDVEGNIAFTNPALDHMFGYEPGELAGQRVSVLHVTAGDDWQDLLEEIRLALRMRGYWTGELDHSRKDGSTFTALAQIRAMRNGDREYWVCVIEDTTQYRAKERAIHDAEDRLSMAMAAASMGAWELDPRTDRLTASANVRALMPDGADRPVVSMEDFFATLHVEDRDRVRQAVHDALAGTRDYDVEFRGVSDNPENGSQVRWLAARAKVFRDECGQPLRMTGVTMDITDRRAAELLLRQSEERFRLAAEAVAALIYDWDQRSGTVLRSPALAKIVGFTPDEADANERWWRERLHPDDLPASQERLDRAIAENESGFAVEYRVRHRDGHWVHVWDRCMIVRDPAGQITRIIGSAVDVTELKRAQHELQKAKEVAESADRAKDQFLAVLSHELRTPLTPVLSAVQLWSSDESVPAQAREDLEMIRRNVELEARLIDDLLDLTRVARGKIDLQLQPCDAHLAIERAVEMCRPEITDKNLQLTIDLSAPRSVINADAARLQQIVWNLVQNAVKFTPGNRRINVQTACEDDRLVVRVNDDGIGIAPESLGRIFDAFEQISRDVTRRFGGLGLGLTISKKLVDLHGGELAAESDGIDRGSTFILRFPLAPVDQSIATTEPHDEADGPRVTLADHEPLRILLVEDHTDTANMMARLLRANHYQVQTAGNVTDALELASRELFDVVISDLGLPDGTGHDLMRRLLDRSGLIKGIALTGFGMESDLDRSRESGFSEHLTKPVDLHRLEASIQRVVRAE
ncbi:hypothetical protein BH09PLA1_BH09PLA1_17920 [soil metagenome]